MPDDSDITDLLKTVSRETLESLRAFNSELLKWSRSVNLVAPSTHATAWERHILDSAQIALLAPANTKRWCDLGSGGGLPGIVLAILARETSPATDFVLIESDKRKAAFLRMQIKAFDLRATVIVDRIETAPPQDASVISARALAPLPQLLHYALRHRALGATLLFSKGRGHQAELLAARDVFEFTAHTHGSATDPDAVILAITDLHLRGTAR